VTPRIQALDRCDALYLATHAGDVDLSCPARLLGDRERGLRTLVVTLFCSGRDPDLAGPESFAVGIPDAPRRDAAYSSRRARRLSGAHEDPCLPEAVRLLDEILRQARPRHVYLPLAVGEDLDHRIAQEAGLRALPPRHDLDVFFYEERPDALVPGAVRLRLAELGARLPPAAGPVAREGGLVRHVLRQQTLPRLRDGFEGWSERAQGARLSARQWLDLRPWNPLRSLGPRLQPLLHEPGQRISEKARDQVRGWVARVGASPLLGDKLVRLGADYGRRLRGSPGAERLWLLLPAMDAGGVSSTAPTPRGPASAPGPAATAR
jgi:hypothetical protein